MLRLRSALILVLVCLSMSSLAASAQGQFPDLVANNVNGPASAVGGQTVNIIRDITNLGGGFPGVFSYEIRLSTNSIISSTDFLVATLSSTTFGPASVNVTIPANVPPGNYFWGIIALPVGSETNIANNALAGNFTQIAAGPADLVAVNASGPATAAPGQTISITRDVGNNGGPLTATFFYDIVLSADGVIDGTDLLIGSFQSTTLGPLMINVTIPMNIAVGTYTFGLVVFAAAGETNTADNVVAGATISIQTTTPTLQSVMPNLGPTSGGTTVTLTGTNFVAPTTVTFDGVVATNVTVVSPTIIICDTPAAVGGQPGAVAVAISNANGAASAANAYTYVVTNPGSNEDFVMTTSVAGTAFDGMPVKSANPGDVVSVRFESPMGTFDGRTPTLGAQVYSPGMPPFAIVGFPEIHIDPVGGLIVFNGLTAQPFPVVLQPGGMTFHFNYPGGFAGQIARFQAVAIDSAAANGFFAATDAFEFTLN